MTFFQFSISEISNGHLINMEGISKIFYSIFPSNIWKNNVITTSILFVSTLSMILYRTLPLLICLWILFSLILEPTNPHIWVLSHTHMYIFKYTETICSHFMKVYMHDHYNPNYICKLIISYLWLMWFLSKCVIQSNLAQHFDGRQLKSGKFLIVTQNKTKIFYMYQWISCYNCLIKLNYQILKSSEWWQCMSAWT